jgi:chromosome partitioning protein
MPAHSDEAVEAAGEPVEAAGEPVEAAGRAARTRVVTVANQKGGVGKTTTAVNVGAELARRARVLLVDLDPQANATSSLGLDPGEERASTYDALLGDLPLAEAIVATAVPGLDLAPASRVLAGAQVELVDLPDRERRLERALGPVVEAGGYDVVLVDTPPSLGLLTLNALVGSDLVLVPVQCEYLALEGLGQLVETLELVRGSLNPRLVLVGILLTMLDSRTNLSAQVAAEVRRHFPAATFATVIPRSVRLSEAPSFGRPIRLYDASSRGARAYAALADELARRLGLPAEGAPGRSGPDDAPAPDADRPDASPIAPGPADRAAEAASAPERDGGGDDVAGGIGARAGTP